MPLDPAPSSDTQCESCEGNHGKGVMNINYIVVSSGLVLNSRTSVLVVFQTLTSMHDQWPNIVRQRLGEFDVNVTAHNKECSGRSGQFQPILQRRCALAASSALSVIQI